MGAGKTTVGNILAKKLGYKYLDADNLIEKQIGKKITEIFSEHGEGYFRELESEVIETLSKKERYVIGTGGGVVMRDANWEAMKRGGLTIYLKTPMAVLWERIKNSKSRPLLKTQDPLRTATELLEKRAPFYERADIIINTENLPPDSVALEIIRLLKANC